MRISTDSDAFDNALREAQLSSIAR
jgi:hypothetical protein